MQLNFMGWVTLCFKLKIFMVHFMVDLKICINIYAQTLSLFTFYVGFTILDQQHQKMNTSKELKSEEFKILFELSDCFNGSQKFSGYTPSFPRFSLISG